MPPRLSRGVALPIVLLILAALGAISTSVISKGVIGRVDSTSTERRVRERLLVEAAIARGIHALLVRDDSMTERLLRGEPVTWSFANRIFRIEARPESNKLDLNSADSGALAVVLDQAVGPELGPKAHATALSKRGELSNPDLILPLLERFSLSGKRLRDVVTVFKGQIVTSVAQGTVPADNVAAADGGLPIYTVQVGLNGSLRMRSVTVLIEPETHRFIILDQVDLESDGSVSDQ